MRILVLGASGMLGHAMVRVLAREPHHQVWGGVRSAQAAKHFAADPAVRIVIGSEAENEPRLASMMREIRPEVVINCIGLVKQTPAAADPIPAISINALLPHQLARLCGVAQARLVHVSTDCVFSGRQGGYTEADMPDATDLYGRSKLLGEVDYPHAITLRTSIIGQELASAKGLVSWLLTQQGVVRGFTRAIFSGLPSCELAAVIRDVVIPRPELRGIFHVASAPISKYDLLHLINKEYKKDLHIEPDGSLQINRSLDASHFRSATGYAAPPWPDLIARMHRFHETGAPC